MYTYGGRSRRFVGERQPSYAPPANDLAVRTCTRALVGRFGVITKTGRRIARCTCVRIGGDRGARLLRSRTVCSAADTAPPHEPTDRVITRTPTPRRSQTLPLASRARTFSQSRPEAVAQLASLTMKRAGLSGSISNAVRLGGF